MKNYRYYGDNGLNYSLSNFVSPGGKPSVVDLQDLITDSKLTKDLLKKLQDANLFGVKNMELDKETDTFVRVKFEDNWGNISYLQAEFDERQRPKENSLRSYYLASKGIVLNEADLLNIYQFYKLEMLKEYITENYNFSKEEIVAIASETQRIMSKSLNYSEDEAIQEAIVKLDLEPLSYE